MSYGHKFPLVVSLCTNFFCFLGSMQEMILMKLIMLRKVELDMRQFATKKCEESCDIQRRVNFISGF